MSPIIFLTFLIIVLNCVSSQVIGPLTSPLTGSSDQNNQEFKNEQLKDQNNQEFKNQQLKDQNNQEFKNEELNNQILPSLQIILIVHPFNKFNELPFVLSGIEQQNYPKDRLNILIQTEIYESVNSAQYDRTIERFKYNYLTIRQLKNWKNSIESEYHKFELKLNQLDDDEDESAIDYWSTSRYEKLMHYKSYAFNYALNHWADYCLFQDADVILTNLNTFRNVLIRSSNDNAIILSPMLFSFSLYSNFWAGIDENGYYKRTDDYVPILERQKIGQFKVPMVHSFVFINLRDKRTRNLKFKFKDLEKVAQFKGQLNKIPFDDIIVFAKSVESLNLSMYVDNRDVYGFIMPPIDKPDLNRQRENLIDLELESLVETNEMFKVVNSLEQYHYTVDKRKDLKINKIYVINLERRKERKIYMRSVCDLLGLNCEFINAVDGKLIDEQYLIENKISIMKNYLDPFHKRPMTYGEIGCFMSHFNIWLDIVRNNYTWSIVFEDDVRFEKDFINKLNRLMDSILKSTDQQIDFIYLGRKREGKPEEESWFNNLTVHPTYSYWTIGYLINLSGAKKLVDSKPLDKMIPVDEMIPIMFDKHPNQEWSNQFEPRNLIALSAHPLLIQPLHYVGDDQYISDTEDSIKLNVDHSKHSEL